MSINSWKQGKTQNWGFIPAALIGSAVAYLITAFLVNFHPQTVQFLFISLASLLVCQFGAIVFLEDLLQNPLQHARANWIPVLIFLTVLLMMIMGAATANNFPGLFNRQLLFMRARELVLFIFLAAVAAAGTMAFSRSMTGSSQIDKFKSTLAYKSVMGNFPGLLLAAFFFLTYLVFAETINFPGFRTLDQFFDFDISDWLTRLTNPSTNDIPVIRPVHPAILLILRPLVWLLSIFLDGNRLQALFLLHALTASSCVFMLWLIVKQMTGNMAFSLLIPSLLGTSASHLLLGSMIETYIYSAFGLILFSHLMLAGRTMLRATVPAGLLISGITVSNIVQTVLLYISSRSSFTLVIKYVLLVILLLCTLYYIENRVYPRAHAPLASSTLNREFNYIHIPDLYSWKFMGRVSLMVRTITLYSIVAPQPFIVSEELGLEGIPHFRTYKITIGQFHVAGYSGLADLTAKFWFSLLVLAFVVFAMGLIKSPATALVPSVLVLCLGFNFLLHTFYGDDPMLYSPDWVYALMLFLAHVFKPWANHKWLQLTLTLLLVFMIVTNLNLMNQILEASAPIYSR